MPTQTEAICHRQEQFVTEQLEWARANSLAGTEREFDAYRAGLQQGWSNAVASLRLHGWLKEG